MYNPKNIHWKFAIFGLIKFFIIASLPLGFNTLSSSSSVAQEVYTESGVNNFNASVTENVYDMDSIIGFVNNSNSFPAEPQVGGFVITVNKISGERLFVGKICAETSESPTVPQAKIGLNDVTIQELGICKNLTPPNSNPSNITITGDMVSITGGPFRKDLELQVSELYGKNLTAKAFGVLPVTLNDYWSTQPEDDLLLRLSGLTLPTLEGTDLKMNTHSLKADRITIQNFMLSVEPGHKSF